MIAKEMWIVTEFEITLDEFLKKKKILLESENVKFLHIDFPKKKVTGKIYNKVSKEVK